MRPRRKVVTWQSVGPIIPVVLVLTVGALVWHYLVRDSDLPAEELRAMIVGNTIEGLWGEAERRYRHFAGPQGAGLTSLEDAPLQVDPWHIGEDGAYCAVLGGSERGCYRARPHDDHYLWIDEANDLGYPFQVLPGRQLGTAGESG